MVDTTIEYTSINGLTLEENRELEGVLNPPESIDKSTRPVMFKVQADHRQDNRRNNPEEFIDLEGRVIGSQEARDKTINKIQLEEVREQLEEDIPRLQRFKKWAKENMVGLSALAVSTAGIITTIIIDARKAILHGAQATGKFAKALYNLGKKLGSLAAPILNILAQAISLGAKEMAWLASNLWMLVVVFTLYIVGECRKRRKIK